MHHINNYLTKTCIFQIIYLKAVAVFLLIVILLHIFSGDGIINNTGKIIKLLKPGELQCPNNDNTDIYLEQFLPKYSNPNRYMIYECSDVCGGLGDRQKGIVAAYLISLLANRTFGIVHTKPMDIISFVRPNKIDWYITKSKVEGLSTHNHFPMQSTTFKARLSTLDFNQFYTKDVIYFRGNLEFVPALRHHYDAVKVFPDIMRMSNSDIYHTVLTLLFKLEISLQEELKTINENQIKGRKLVCAHMRMGRNPTIPTDISPKLHTNELDLIWNFMDQYKQPDKNSIFVASDSIEIKNIAKQRYPLQYVDVPGPIVHIDQIGYKNESAGMMKLFLEQSLLSQCDVLIVTKSGFSRIAAYIRNTSRDLYCYLNGTLFPCRHDLLDQIYVIY